MTRFQNGRIPGPGQPGSPLTVIGTGTDSNGYWEFQISAHTLALWDAAKTYAEKHFGKTLHIRTGWNCYRPYDVQVAARQRACAAGNCNAAASAGYSSHGGTWIDSHFTGGVWVDAMAIDVDPNGLTWAQVWEACTAAGFLCNAITIQRAGIAEPWHIIDLHPWDAIPSDVGPVTPVDLTQEDDMITISSPNRGYALVGPGYFHSLAAGDAQWAGEISSKVIATTDAKFDIWRRICTEGDVNFLPPVSVPTVATDVWSWHVSGNATDPHAAAMLTAVTAGVAALQAAPGVALTDAQLQVIAAAIAAHVQVDAIAQAAHAGAQEAISTLTLKASS